MVLDIGHYIALWYICDIMVHNIIYKYILYIMVHKWMAEVEKLCEKLRINCVNLSEYHRRRYYHFKSYGKYFRLPMIILASINATASVGLQPVLEQPYISGITCLIGMMMGILGAIELYLGIQSSMELELKQSKDFYSLAIDVYKTLQLKPEDRGEDGKDYLNKKYGMYVKLCEASNLLKRQLTMDLLTQIPSECVDRSRGVTPIEMTRPDGSKHVVLKENESWIRYVQCCFEVQKVPVNFFHDHDENLQLYPFSNHTEPYVPGSPLVRYSTENSEVDTSEYSEHPTSDVENQYYDTPSEVVDGEMVYNVHEELHREEKENELIDKPENELIDKTENELIDKTGKDSDK
jgi:hypothetical protein